MQVCLTGTVVRAASVKQIKSRICFVCDRCGSEHLVRCKLEEGGVATPPEGCSSRDPTSGKPCHSHRFTANEAKTVYTWVWSYGRVS